MSESCGELGKIAEEEKRQAIIDIKELEVHKLNILLTDVILMMIMMTESLV